MFSASSGARPVGIVSLYVFLFYVYMDDPYKKSEMGPCIGSINHLVYADGK